MKFKKKRIYSSLSQPEQPHESLLSMRISWYQVSKNTMYTMAQVKTTGALLGLMLQQKKIIYSDVGRKTDFTKLIKKSKLWMVSDVEGNFNYMIFALCRQSLTSTDKMKFYCLYLPVNQLISYFISSNSLHLQTQAYIQFLH